MIFIAVLSILKYQKFPCKVKIDHNSEHKIRKGIFCLWY